MLTLIDDLPDGVVGVEAHGKVTAEDYENVLEAARRDGKVRLRSWERIAVVSDEDWLRRAIGGLGRLMPGEIKVFETDDLDDVREWVASLLPEGEKLY